MKIEELRKMVMEACADHSPSDMGVGPQAADGKEKVQERWQEPI